jgi:hypothetical protein
LLLGEFGDVAEIDIIVAQCGKPCQALQFFGAEGLLAHSLLSLGFAFRALMIRHVPRRHPG